MSIQLLWHPIFLYAQSEGKHRNNWYPTNCRASGLSFLIDIWNILSKCKYLLIWIENIYARQPVLSESNKNTISDGELTWAGLHILAWGNPQNLIRWALIISTSSQSYQQPLPPLQPPSCFTNCGVKIINDVRTGLGNYRERSVVRMNTISVCSGNISSSLNWPSGAKYDY